MEPITAVIEVIDRIVDLLRRREIQREEYFDKVIQPLYDNLSAVVDDTFAFLSELYNAVQSGEYKSESVNRFRDRRQKLLSLRIRIRASAIAIRNGTSDTKCQEFASGVSELFFLSDRSYDRGTAPELSTQHSVVDLLEQEVSAQSSNDWNSSKPVPDHGKFISVNSPSFEQTMLHSIELSRSRLEARWQKLSVCFAELQQARYK